MRPAPMEARIRTPPVGVEGRDEASGIVSCYLPAPTQGHEGQLIAVAKSVSF